MRLREAWSKERGSKRIRVLEEHAQEHADSNDFLVGLPHQPKQYKGQDYRNVYHCEDKPQATFIKAVAKDILSDYPDYLDAISQEKNARALDFSKHLISSGVAIKQITNHGNIVDVAIAHSGTAISIEEVTGEFPKCRIVANKIIGYLGARSIDGAILPAIDILSLYSDTYLTFAKTNTMMRHNLPATIVDNTNKSTRKRLKFAEKREGGITAIAATGTTEKPSQVDPNLYEVEPINPATSLMMRGWVLPTVISFDPKDISILDPVYIDEHTDKKRQSIEQSHQVMSDIYSELENIRPNKKYSYTPR